MKKFILSLSIFLVAATASQAQLLPKFQLGVKGGVNLTSLSNSGSTFNSDNRAGYLGGLWARFGALGFNFQPEIYVTSKNVDLNSGNTSNHAKFTSIDVPLLFGGKVGAFGFGGRFYTGPLFSFAINEDQNAGTALGNAITLNPKGQNVAWNFGAGLDVKMISVDLRYEAGITKQSYNSSNDQTRISLFTVSVGYRLFKL